MPVLPYLLTSPFVPTCQVEVGKEDAGLAAAGAGRAGGMNVDEETDGLEGLCTLHPHRHTPLPFFTSLSAYATGVSPSLQTCMCVFCLILSGSFTSGDWRGLGFLHAAVSHSWRRRWRTCWCHQCHVTQG